MALHAAVAVATAGCAGDRLAALGDRIVARIAESGAEVVGVYFKDLVTGDSLSIAADVRVHAASMMKVPVMIQLFRDHEAGLSSLDDSLTITKTFESIVDGSPYELGAPDDSDTTLYRRVGQRESVRRLSELMITVSSNLATNMLIEHVGADRVTATMRELGADSIEVLRGVEDTEAYRAGLSNTTTARDLGVIFTAIAEGRAVRGVSGRQMIEILLRQEFNTKIPAGLPPGARAAHKTGWIPDYVSHDGGIVYLDGGDVYVLVVLTEGGEGHDDYAEELIADISRMVYDVVRSSAQPRPTSSAASTKTLLATSDHPMRRRLRGWTPSSPKMRAANAVGTTAAAASAGTSLPTARARAMAMVTALSTGARCTARLGPVAFFARAMMARTVIVPSEKTTDQTTNATRVSRRPAPPASATGIIVLESATEARSSPIRVFS